MSELIVVGGVNSDAVQQGKGWAAYKAGKIVSIDLTTLAIKELAYDAAVPDWISSDKEIGTVYKTSYIDADRALICTTTEVFEYTLPGWTVKRRVSHKKFNDVHHVIPYENDNILVVSTGLDTVLEIDWNGKIHDYWCLSDKTKYMFIDDVDYRNVESTKPHAIHPNHISNVNGALYVSMFQQQAAVCINRDDKKTLHVKYGNIHDGLVKDDAMWFTSTNGWVAAVDIADGTEKFSLNINELYKGERPLGWCRGLAFIDESSIAVGFSRLRKTKFEDNIRWVVSKLSKAGMTSMLTRIVIIDINTKCINCEIDLEKNDCLNSVFSIHKNDL